MIRKLFTNFTNAISLLELHEHLAATLTIKNHNYVTLCTEQLLATLLHTLLRSVSLQSDLELSTFENKTALRASGTWTS